MAKIDDRVPCLSEGCTFRSHSILDHLREVHDLSAEEYAEKHAGAATLSQRALDALDSLSSVRRVAAPLPANLTVSMMSYTNIPVQASIPEDECLPLPEGYMFPTKGKAKDYVDRVLMALLAGRSAFIWGEPGTGKDASVHAYSALTRRPVMMVTFRPGTDIGPWFYTRSITEKGTGWEYGHMWMALTEGVLGRDGKRYPVTVLLSDVDRADTSQAEWFRLILDSISGRILGPDGKMVTIFPGTNFICTSNTCGTGDPRGRMISSNPIDASIKTRLGRKIQAAYMHWDDEGKILRARFPLLNEKAPDLFVQLGKATEALRNAIEREELYAEFDMRALCDILFECQDTLQFKFTNKSAPDNLLKRGFQAWLQGVEIDGRVTAQRLIDPFLKGGALETN